MKDQVKKEATTSGLSAIKYSSLFFILIEILAFLIMFFLTHREPLMSDDFRYSVKPGDDGALGFAVRSGIAYYRNSGGRCFVNGIRAFMLASDQLVFDITNALVYVALATLVYFFSYPKSIGKRNNLWLIGVYCLLWFFIPSFGGLTLWLTGSVAYLWPSVILLAFVYTYFKRFSEGVVAELPVRKDSRISIILRCFGMLLLGFFAGCSIEPDACALVVMLVLWIVYMRKAGKKIRNWEWCGCIAALAGFIFLFASPGIYNRAYWEVTESTNLFIRYGRRFFRETYYAGKYLLLPAGLALSLLWLGKKPDLKRDKEVLALLLMSFFGVYAMTFSPGFSVRVMLFPVILVVCAIGIAWRRQEAAIGAAAETIMTLTLVLLCGLHITTAVIQTEFWGNKALRRDTIYTAENAEKLFPSTEVEE